MTQVWNIIQTTQNPNQTNKNHKNPNHKTPQNVQAYIWGQKFLHIFTGYLLSSHFRHFSASLAVLVNNIINSWSWPQTAKPKLHSKIYSVYKSCNATNVKNIKTVFLLNYPLSKHKLYNSLKHFKKHLKCIF